MNVGELIAELSKHDASLRVVFCAEAGQVVAEVISVDAAEWRGTRVYARRGGTFADQRDGWMFKDDRYPLRDENGWVLKTGDEMCVWLDGGV